jgi:hypothetical protein
MVRDVLSFFYGDHPSHDDIDAGAIPLPLEIKRPARRLWHMLSLGNPYLPVLLLVLYIGLALIEFRSLFKRKKYRTQPDPDDIAPPTGNQNPPSYLRHYSILIGTILILLLVFSYFIASNEQLLQRNPDLDNANKVWGFGQVSVAKDTSNWVLRILTGRSTRFSLSLRAPLP